MGLEVGTFLNDLVTTNPVGATDPKSQGDDHLRLIKSVLKNTFPGLAGSAFRIQSKTANYTVVATDNMSVLSCTGLTLTLTAAATLGNKHMFVVIASATDVILSRSGSDKINGANTITLTQGQYAFVFCDGVSDFQAILGGTSYSTGDVKFSVRAAAETGWVLAFGTIGDGSSGASNRASSDCKALFMLLWNDWADAQAPVSTGRGASALADWNAHKTIGVPDLRGRGLAGKDNMGGSAASRLTSTTMSPDGNTLGATGGTETNTADTDSTGTTSGTLTVAGTAGGGTLNLTGGAGVQALQAGDPISGTASGSLSVSASGTSDPFGIVQPTMLMNVFIKL